MPFAVQQFLLLWHGEGLEGRIEVAAKVCREVLMVAEDWYPGYGRQHRLKRFHIAVATVLIIITLVVAMIAGMDDCIDPASLHVRQQVFHVVPVVNSHVAIQAKTRRAVAVRRAEAEDGGRPPPLPWRCL